ncbi:SGNH/GDSL hydrolase family protein [Demequina maris]|uniref:SGNH/GDSL hydrolase family protein n=1 Tax=Demequina maris TaxID=1638982 RepID=UPI0007833308|nr:SGNH/GDSL hydrolase family protein [Demequina maris]
MTGFGARRRDSWLTREWAGVQLWAILAMAVLLVAIGGVWFAHAAKGSGATAAASASPTGGPPEALFLGDSYTLGTGASDEAHRWSTLVSEDQGWVELNYGRVGAGYSTADDCKGDSCFGLAEAIGEAVDAGVEPDIVIISGGLFDRDHWLADSEAVTAAVDATYAELRDQFPRTPILAVGPYFPWGPLDWKFDFDDAVEAAADSIDADYVSLLRPKAVKFKQNNFGDALHVNDDGHQLIAKRVIEAVESR